MWRTLRMCCGAAPVFAMGFVLAFGGCGHGSTTATSTTGDPPPFCGDKIVQPDIGEECDDGAKDDSGPCLSTCKNARCGDGALWTGMEECDDANSDETDQCLSNCNLARCGDGYVEKGVEQCDDGNEEDNDACSSLCKPGIGCGNGQIDVGEECDDGNTSNFDGCVAGCKKAKCGDGYGEVGVEDCDDGNDVDTDACSNACKVNPIKNAGCPGTPIALTMNAPVTLGINGGEQVANETGSCGGDGPEVVYAFTPSDDGLMKLKLLPLSDAYDAVLYVRSSCSDATSEIICENRAGNGGLEAAEVPVMGGQTYYVFADARDAADTGRFFLNAELTGDVQGDNCPGVPVKLALDQTATLTGNTMAAHADRIGQGLCAQANTPEIVYEIVPESDGHVFAQLMPTYVAAFYVRTSCGDTRSQLLCAYSGTSGDPLTIDISVAAGHRYYFFVDGALGHAGGYSVAFTLAKS